MTRYEIRKHVHGILRSDGYPKRDIDDAINRVLAILSNSGRYRCQRSTDDITLATNTFSYPVKSTLRAEQVLVFQPNSTSETVIDKGTHIEDAFAEGLFTTTADQPTRYWRWGANWLFDPIPNSVANGKTVRVFGVFDFPQLTGDLDTPSPLPARWHATLLGLGAAAEIAPAALVRTAAGTVSVGQAFTEEFKNFIRDEKWEPYENAQLDLDKRFGGLAGIDKIGNIGGLRQS